MIASSDDVRSRRPSRERLRAASSALADLQLEGVRLLRLRRARVTGWLRRLAWTAATAVMLLAAGAVALAAAVVMTMVGAADLMAWALGVPAAVGWAVIGPLVLITFFLAAGHGKAGPDPRSQASAEAANHHRLGNAFARLWLALGTVPALLLSGLAGALGVAVWKDRRLRRGALLLLSLQRAAWKVAAPAKPAADSRRGVAPAANERGAGR
jgi:hypothetical protein